jgi:predicted membrane metal-binding protein
MNPMHPRRPDLAHGFDRIDDFLAVQGPRITVDAVKLLQEAVGVDDGGRAVVRERVAALVDSGHGAAVGSVLLGILIGLYAAEQE